MIDVTGTDVAPGDEVVIIGRQGDESIGVREMAAAIGTIPYELLCRIGARIQRCRRAVKSHAAQKSKTSEKSEG
jgi:alanine racemase